MISENKGLAVCNTSKQTALGGKLMVAVGDCLWTTNKITEKEVSGRLNFINTYLEIGDNSDVC